MLGSFCRCVHYILLCFYACWFSTGRLNLHNKYFSFLKFQQGSLNSLQRHCSVSALPSTSGIPFAPCPLFRWLSLPCRTNTPGRCHRAAVLPWRLGTAQDSADGNKAGELIYQMQAAEEEVSDPQSLSRASCHPRVSGDVRS